VQTLAQAKVPVIGLDFRDQACKLGIAPGALRPLCRK
jgi:hypothetical protein